MPGKKRANTLASANAQSFLEKLGNRAKNAVERNLGNKVEKAVKDALDCRETHMQRTSVSASGY